MTLVVGINPDKDESCALELAAELARSAEQDLLLITVITSSWPIELPGSAKRAAGDLATARGERAVAAVAAFVAERYPDVHADAIWVAGKSVSSALIEQADSAKAAMIVIGSGSGGPFGRINVNSTGDTLLHSSPIAVAVAPRGYRGGTAKRITRATVGFRGDDASKDAVTRAAALCIDLHISLRIATFAVRGKTMYPPAAGLSIEDEIVNAWIAQSQVAQQEVIAELPSVPADLEYAVSEGRSWTEAVDGLSWQPDEVLVVGSSRTRGLARLFLGSTATKIARSSPVPVIVVP